jgi:hypothetical protein
MEVRKKTFLEKINPCFSVFSNNYKRQATQLETKAVVVLEVLKDKKVISVFADIESVFLRKIS